MSTISLVLIASAAVTVVSVAGKVTIAWLALRDTKPMDRAAIISALARLLRWWR